MPRLSLAVEGLTDTTSLSKAELELSATPKATYSIEPSTELPDAQFDPEQLEVYGWESSFWRKLRGYLGF